MGAATEIEDATHPCPDCGRRCENVRRDVYDCVDHGVFRASAIDDASPSGTQQGAVDDTETDDSASGRAD